MKILLICSLIGAVLAEPPRFRGRFQPQFQRQEVAPVTEPPDQEPTTPPQNGPYPPSQGGPYPPSGWKPAGRAFNLPARQETKPPRGYAAPPNNYGPPPNNQYGPPDNQYGPPTNDYGPPSTTAPEETTTDAAETTTTGNPDSEDITVDARSQRAQQPLANQGAYYVLLPDARLQKVQYRTENDVRNMAYTARLQYKDVEPISGPIYVVSPQYVVY